MSGYRFDDDAGSEDQPDLGQHSEFHFKDADVEDAVTRARRERLEAEESEIEERRKAGLSLAAVTEDDAAKESPLRLDEPWVPPAAPAAPQAAAPQAAAPKAAAPKPAPPHAATANAPEPAEGEDEEPLEDYLVWSEIPPDPGASPAATAPPGAVSTSSPAAGTPHLRPPDTSGQRPRAASQNAARTAASGPQAAEEQAAAAQGAQQAAARPPRRPAPGTSAATTAQSQAADAPLAPAGRTMAQTPPPKPGGHAAGAHAAGATARPAAAAPAATPLTPETLAAQNHLDDSGFNLRGVLDRFDPIAMVIAQISAVAMALSLVYILYGVFGGGIGNPANVKAAQIAVNVAVAAKIFRIASVAMAICTALLMLDESTVGPGIAIAGVALHFGASPVIGSLGKSRAILMLLENARSLGFALLVIGILKSTIDLVRWVIDRPNRMRTSATVGAGAKRDAKQQLIAATATMFSPCWHLPYCREMVRVKCPAFLARKRCWKFGRGCLCDQEMVTRIMSNASLEVIKAPTAMSTRKPPCDRCAIFLEHQSMKFKMLSPLAVPLTAVAGFVGWPIYDRLWAATGAQLPGLWNKLSFSATSAVSNAADNKAVAANDMDKYQLPPEQIAHVAEIMFGVILVFFLLIYMAKFLEWAILKMRW